MRSIFFDLRGQSWALAFLTEFLTTFFKFREICFISCEIFGFLRDYAIYDIYFAESCLFSCDFAMYTL